MQKNDHYVRWFSRNAAFEDWRLEEKNNKTVDHNYLCWSQLFKLQLFMQKNDNYITFFVNKIGGEK
jgi:hypothetical protein